jgi:RyR domain
MSDPLNIVVVTGDFTMDWNLERSQASNSSHWILDAGAATHLDWQRGGSGLLADLVAELTSRISRGAVWQLRQQQTPRHADSAGAPQISPEDPRFHHSCAIWKTFPFSAEAGRKDKPAWRVAEFLGGHISREAPGDWASVAGDDPNAQLVVLDDAALGFRDQPEFWPASLTTEGAAPWVLLKISRPVARGKLWNYLVNHHAARLIVLMTVNDLRQSEAQISCELSWERTAQDLLWEVAFNQGLGSLAQCAHVVVSFDAAGAMHYAQSAGGNPCCRLIFDPEGVEGMWEQAYPGKMLGLTSCLAAGIARAVMLAPDKPDIDEGAHRGLSALRDVYREGYGKRGDEVTDVAFPIVDAVNALEEPSSEFQHTVVPMRRGRAYWTILKDKYTDGLDEVAREVVLRGPEKSLLGIPFGRFGKLLTVDRQEIESLRSIRSLTGEYLRQQQPKRPLSIAVFGPPGSGKSFGITQLAMALKPGEIEKKEFNLSQLRSTAELLSAFHQVRDIGLRGKIPLVFWDEFDSNFDGCQFGWLRYFLAPMQDGEFLEGDVVHPIGRAIFVFAGGTSASLAKFGIDLDEETSHSAKLPDFISRLKGYINVLGPNPREDADDPYFVLRRAILLRSLLLGGARHLERGGGLQIDPGVLRALLLTRKYKHGARSMESLIAMSQLDGKSSFERSSLPTRAQMDLHVDGQNFLALVHQLELTPALIEKLAEAAHEMYCRQQRDALEKKDLVGQKQLEANRLLVTYDELPEHIKEQNRDQVRSIPEKLAYAGCYLIPAVEGEPPFEFDDEMVEELASAEHTRWMRMKVHTQWKWGDPRDDKRRLHNCMLPWKKGELTPYAGFEAALGVEELPDPEKEKDRETVRAIGQIVALAGYTIVAQRNS